MKLNKFPFIAVLIFFLSSCSNVYEKLESDPILRQDVLPSLAQPEPESIPTANNPRLIKKKIKVAALLPFSGKNKNLGEIMLNSMTLSLFENDKEANIELVLLDSEEMKKAVNEIVDQEIKIVIGPIFSNKLQELTKLTKGQEITVLSFSNNEDLSGQDGVFLTGLSPSQEIERITDYTILQGDDNFAVIAPFNEYGRTFSALFTAFVKQKGGNIIGSKLYLNNNRHLEKSVKEALETFIIAPDAEEKNKMDITDEDKFYANVIFVPESGKKLSKIVRLINKYNKDERPIKIIGSSGWNNMATLEDPNLIGSWFASTDPEKYRDFEKRYYQIYKEFPPKVSSIAFDVVFAVSSVIRASNSRIITKDDFVNYNSGDGFEGLDGLFRFLPNGLVQRDLVIMEVKDGKFKVVNESAKRFFKF